MNSAILHRILWVRGLRAFADGYVSLLLPVYLTALGMQPFQVGVIATSTLLGSGVLTIWVGFRANRYRYRTLLLMAAILMTGTGIGFATITNFWPLLLIAIIGTLNPSSGDVSVFLPLEHAVLSQAAEDRRRTVVFARYSLVGSLISAFGALAAGLPDMLATTMNVRMMVALKAMFALYGAIGLLSWVIYRSLPDDWEHCARTRVVPLKQSKRHIVTLAALFSLDSLGGGFVVQSMLALWLFQKFQLSTLVAGTLFFWSGILSALSYFVAVRIADRFGLLNTIVFTHLPSGVLLVLIPFMPTLPWAIALLLLRSALSQMDVPTRSSYVMAITPPDERAAAASMTSVPRSLAAAISPMVAGYLLSLTSFGWPLILGGGMKLLYDVLLYTLFRNVQPPEENLGR